LAEVAAVRSASWDDLAKDMENPAFAREFVLESARIAMIDAVINSLNEARISAGLSKAALARAIGAEPATVRRLFSASGTNPTLGTVAEVATALGLRIALEPLPEPHRRNVTSSVQTPAKATDRDRKPRRRSNRAA
jgi:DNA-binding phage protein